VESSPLCSVDLFSSLLHYDSTMAGAIGLRQQGVEYVFLLLLLL
jgi:hypothetical protein